MDNQAFEQVIDLKDKPSERKNSTPEVKELYKQGYFNHLFSIEEEVPLVRAVCNRKRTIILACFIITVASVVTVVALFYSGTFDAGRSDTIHDQPNTTSISNGDNDTSVQTTTILEELETTSLGTKSLGTTSLGTTSLVTTAQVQSVCPNVQMPLDDGIQGCVSSPLPACRSINLCETFLPNRFNLGDSLTKLQETYNEFTNKLNFTCHPYAIRFLCFRISPPCPKVAIQETPEPYYAFDVINFPHVDVPLPCKSLCENISETCMEDELDITDLSSRCSTLPESTSEEVCFGSDLAQVNLCNSFTCENGGSCFTVYGRQYCKCQLGYYGTHCETNTSSDYRVTQGHCVSVPEQCRSVLPYNTTRGLNLSDSNFAYIAGWERITPMAYEGIKDTRVTLLFCGLFYPPCAPSNDSVSIYIVCWELCFITKIQFKFILASLGFPPLMCEKLHKQAPPGHTCLS